VAAEGDRASVDRGLERGMADTAVKTAEAVPKIELCSGLDILATRFGFRKRR